MRIFRFLLMTAFAAVQFRSPFFSDVAPRHWVPDVSRLCDDPVSICILRPLVKLVPPQYRKQWSPVTDCHSATRHKNCDITFSDCLEADVCTVSLKNFGCQPKVSVVQLLLPETSTCSFFVLFLNLGHYIAGSSNTVANFRLLQEAENF